MRKLALFLIISVGLAAGSFTKDLESFKYGDQFSFNFTMPNRPVKIFLKSDDDLMIPLVVSILPDYFISWVRLNSKIGGRYDAPQFHPVLPNIIGCFNVTFKVSIFRDRLMVVVKSDQIERDYPFWYDARLRSKSIKSIFVSGIESEQRFTKKAATPNMLTMLNLHEPVNLKTPLNSLIARIPGATNDVIDTSVFIDKPVYIKVRGGIYGYLNRLLVDILPDQNIIKIYSDDKFEKRGGIRLIPFKIPSQVNITIGIVNYGFRVSINDEWFHRFETKLTKKDLRSFEMYSTGSPITRVQYYQYNGDEKKLYFDDDEL